MAPIRIRSLLLFLLSVLSALILLRSTPFVSRVLAPLLSHSMSSTASGADVPLPKTQADWKKALDDLPSTPDKIPAFFFGHGSPMLAFPENDTSAMSRGEVGKAMGPKSPLAKFLKDFGPALLAKYKPKGIVVFSAHWETAGERLGMSSMSPSSPLIELWLTTAHPVTDYGDENPLLYDYYGFQPALYQLKFKSRGDSALSQRVVQLYKDVGSRFHTGVLWSWDLIGRSAGRLFGEDHHEAPASWSGRPRIQRSRSRPWRFRAIQAYVRRGVYGHSYRGSVDGLDLGPSRQLADRPGGRAPPVICQLWLLLYRIC